MAEREGFEPSIGVKDFWYQVASYTLLYKIWDVKGIFIS